MLISMCFISYVDWGASQQASGQSQASPQQKPPDDLLHQLLRGA